MDINVVIRLRWLNELFKNTTYDDTLFSAEAKSAIESRIFMKSVRGSEVPYITCAIRDKEIKLTPEEAVRQGLTDVTMDFLPLRANTPPRLPVSDGISGRICWHISIWMTEEKF